MSDLPEQSLEQGERMIEAVKITAVFSNAKVLESIATGLLEQGLISGFHFNFHNHGEASRTLLAVWQRAP